MTRYSEPRNDAYTHTEPVPLAEVGLLALPGVSVDLSSFSSSKFTSSSSYPLSDHRIVDSESLLSQMGKPHQQGFEAQTVQIEFAAASARRSQIGPVYPDPDITQQQRNADKQQPQGGIAGGGFDASLTELARAGLDAEAIAVDLEDPLGGFRCNAPKGIN